MITLIRQQARVFIRRWPLTLVAIGSLVATLVAGVHEFYLLSLPGSDVLNSLANYSRYWLVLPLAVLALSFETTSAARIIGMEESVAAHAKTAHRHWLATMVPPAAVSLTVFVVFLTLKLAAAFMADVHRVLGWHLVSVAVLNVLAPCVIALLVGFLAARHLKRFAGYAAIAMFAFLTGPYSEILPMVAQAGILQGGSGLNLYPVFDLFAVLAPDSTWYVDPLYGFPVEQERWLLAGFWVAGLSGALLPTIANPYARRTGHVRLALVALAGSLFTASMLPSHELRRDYRYFGGSSTVSEQVYYKVRADENPVRDEPARFRVSKYEIDMSAGRQLTADVTVTIVDDEQGGDYHFTLYHGYRISRVLDSAGRRLEFVQDGDYVTVTSDERHERLTFSYRGSGGLYPANSQCVFLPGYFPYYPVPGFVRVWDELFAAPVMDVDDEATVEFTVSFRFPTALYSDLEQQDGRFRGYSAAPTFVGGLAASEEVAGLEVVYYPAGAADPEGLRSLLARVHQLEKELGVSESIVPTGTRVFQAPEFHHAGAVKLPGSLFVSGFHESLAADVVIAGSPRRIDRSNLKEAFVRYVNDPTWSGDAGFVAMPEPGGEDAAERLPSNMEIAGLERARREATTDFALVQDYVHPARRAVSSLFLAKVRAEGREEALRDTYRYLVSDSPMSELEFLTRSANGEMQ